MRMQDIKHVLAKMATDKLAYLGYGGAGTYWLFEHMENIMGICLAGITVISTAAYQWHRIASLRAEERRKEELHQKKMERDV